MCSKMSVRCIPGVLQWQVNTGVCLSGAVHVCSKVSVSLVCSKVFAKCSLGVFQWQVKPGVCVPGGPGV